MRALVLSLLYLCLCRVFRAQYVTLNPCNVTQPDGIEKGGTLIIGLAYWPGGSLQMWGNASKGLHPCYDSGLADVGVTVAAFSLKADSITVLSTSRRDEANLYDTIKGSSSLQVMSVIAFAGKYRSDARYIWSEASALTTGTGVVGSLSLILNFNKGALQWMQWQDVGCSGCNKTTCVKSAVINAQSCAINQVAECPCYLANNTLGANACVNPDNLPANACHTGIQVGTTGTDKNSKTLVSGVQLQKISGYNVARLFSNAKYRFNNTFTGISNNATGNVFNQS